METNKRHKALVVDDSFMNREILKDILADETDIVEVDNGQAAVDYLRDHFYDLDIVLLDLIMPGMNGFEVLEFMKQKHMTEYLPVIMISADDEEKNIEYAFDLGAIDFISRPFSERIVLRRVLTTISLFEKQKKLINQIDRQFRADDQRIDSLTGLDYKETFYNNVYTQLRSRGGDHLCMIAIDINHFKLYNNFYGWDKGDAYLHMMGKYLKEFTRQHGGVAGYLGGDDFAVLCPNKAVAFKELELRAKQDALKSEGFGVGFGPKFGIYAIENPTEAVQKIYGKALRALNSISNDYTKYSAWYSDSLKGGIKDEYELLTDVHRGVEAEEFTFYLQPKVDMRTREIVGAESLARWNHKDKGLLTSSRFIPTLEKSTFISSLDRILWEKLIAWMGQCLKEKKDLKPISINVARADFYAVDVSDYLTELLNENGVPNDLLEIEIAEGTFIRDSETIEAEVDKLHHAGFKILMDDFGRGYSSIKTLRNMNIDVLKIDMKFMDMDAKPQKREVGIIEGVLNVAKTLGVPVSVEGVEKEAQVEFLLDKGCDRGQGFLFYEAMPPEEFEKLL
ncbi:MAG: EAL domain-containing protein [Lachnospiraceae bacterium]|nr:EAL domain-containing protein [Lachnospiraceae bacterium]